MIRGLVASLVLLTAAGAAHAQPGTFETTTFGEDTFAIGSLTSQTGAMPSNLWQGAEAEDIGYLLGLMPTRFADATSADIMRRALLSPGEGPAGADAALTGQKLMALARAGFYEEAASLAELSGGLSSRPALSQPIAYAAMMEGDMGRACAVGANLEEGRREPFWLKMRLLCYSINGETAAADLMLGLRRDLDLLEGDDEVLFTSLATGTAPRKAITPMTGFHYAAVRQLRAELDLSRLSEADGAVLRAFAGEEAAPQLARVQATERSVYLGTMSGAQAAAAFASFSFEPEQIASAEDLLTRNTDNRLVDPLVYQRVMQMTALEDTLDRAALVGEALRRTRDLERFTTLAKIYAPLAGNFEVIVNYAPYAREFVLAGMVAGDAAMTEQWLTAMAADQANPQGREQALELLELLALKDEDQARRLALINNFDLRIPQVDYRGVAGSSVIDATTELAELVAVSLRAFRGGSTGQHALLSLAAANMRTTGLPEDIRASLERENRVASNLDAVYREAAFRRAVAETLAQGPVVAAATGVESDGASATGPAARIVPRVKPSPNG